MEYRAKLTELSMAQKTLYQIIAFFINNANYESDNAHSIANYCVIRDISKLIFKIEFEKDITKWEKIDKKKINETALKILSANTETLGKQGKEVEKYIKK